MTTKIPNKHVHTYLQFLNSIKSYAPYMYYTCYKKRIIFHCIYINISEHSCHKINTIQIT